MEKTKLSKKEIMKEKINFIVNNSTFLIKNLEEYIIPIKVILLSDFPITEFGEYEEIMNEIKMSGYRNLKENKRPYSLKILFAIAYSIMEDKTIDSETKIVQKEIIRQYVKYINKINLEFEYNDQDFISLNMEQLEEAKPFIKKK